MTIRVRWNGPRESASSNPGNNGNRHHNAIPPTDGRTPGLPPLREIELPDNPARFLAGPLESLKRWTIIYESALQFLDAPTNRDGFLIEVLSEQLSEPQIGYRLRRYAEDIAAYRIMPQVRHILAQTFPEIPQRDRDRYTTPDITSAQDYEQTGYSEPTREYMRIGEYNPHAIAQLIAAALDPGLTQDDTHPVIIEGPRRGTLDAAKDDAQGAGHSETSAERRSAAGSPHSQAPGKPETDPATDAGPDNGQERRTRSAPLSDPEAPQASAEPTDDDEEAAEIKHLRLWIARHYDRDHARQIFHHIRHNYTDAELYKTMLDDCHTIEDYAEMLSVETADSIDADQPPEIPDEAPEISGEDQPPEEPDPEPATDEERPADAPGEPQKSDKTPEQRKKDRADTNPPLLTPHNLAIWTHADSDDTRPVLGAIHVGPEGTTATDGKRLITMSYAQGITADQYPKLDGKAPAPRITDPDKPLLIPAPLFKSAAANLKKIKNKSIPILKNAMLTKTESGKTYGLYSTDLDATRGEDFRPIEGTYPNWRQVLPKNQPRYRVAFNAAYLADLAKIALAMNPKNGKIVMEIHPNPKEEQRNLTTAQGFRITNDQQEAFAIIMPLRIKD